MEETKLTLSDYLQIMKRRRWHMFWTFLGVMVLSLVVTFALPAKYRSSAVIMIEGQDIPEDLVRSTITSFADERVQRITQRAMTSINLSRIIDDYELYPWDVERVPRSELIEDMREDITIDLVAADVIDPRSGRPTKATIAFSISFDYRKPVQAQKVANELVTLYRQVNLTEGKTQVESAASFLDDLVQTHQQQVTMLEAQLSELKLKNGGSLPELMPVNMQIMQRLENDLSSTESKLQALKNRSIMLEAQLLQTDPNLPGIGAEMTDPRQALAILEAELRIAESKYASDHPDVVRYGRMVEELRRDNNLGDGSDVEAIDFQITETANQLELARSRYGEEHPEIVSLKRRLTNLRSTRIEALDSLLTMTVTPVDAVVNSINVREGPGTDTPAIGTLARGTSATLVDDGNDEWFKVVTSDGVQGYVNRSVARRVAPEPVASGDAPGDTGDIPTNPAYITLRANLAQAQSEAQGLYAVYQKLQLAVEEKQAVIDQTPMVEREYSALLRDLEASRMRLQDSSAKAEDARIGAMLVSEGKAQAFNLLEPPFTPTQPHWPNRWILLFLGFILSLMGMLAAAAMAENVDDSIRSTHDITALGGAPPLAMIPMIENSLDTRSSRRGLLMVVSGFVATVAIAATAVHFLYKPLDVLWYALMRKAGL